MGSLRMRTIGGTVVLAVLLILAGCSGGGADGTPGATATQTDSPAATVADTTADGGANGPGGGDDASGSELGQQYVFESGEAYAYAVRLPNQTALMSWTVVATEDTDPGPSQEVAVNVSFGQYTANATTTQAGVFGTVISKESAGGPFLYVRTPAVLAEGHDLRVGNSWTVRGENVTVGDGYGVDWERATAEITGTANVSGERCYRMRLRIPDQEHGPTSCVKPDWPFALAVDTGPQDYRLAEFERP